MPPVDRQPRGSVLTDRYQRFDAVDQRFDGVDQRVNGVDRRVDNLGKRMEDRNEAGRAAGWRIGRHSTKSTKAERPTRRPPHRNRLDAYPEAADSLDDDVMG